MEDDEDIFNLEKDLNDAPPIIPINTDNNNNQTSINICEKLIDEKKLKFELIKSKEEEIFKLKMEIIEIDKKIKNIKKESKKIEEKFINLLKEKTEVEIKNKQNEIYNEINNWFEEYKKSQLKNELDKFSEDNNDKLNKLFYNDKIEEFINKTLEAVRMGIDIFKNFEPISDDLIIKFESFLEIKDEMNKIIKLFFKNHYNEKDFIKVLVKYNNNNRNNIVIYLMNIKNDKINNNNIINSND